MVRAIPDEWSRLEKEGLWVPVRAVPKERPQVGSKGAYYSKRYTDFREAVASHLSLVGVDRSELAVPLSLEADFTTNGFYLQLRPIVGWSSPTVCRPAHVRGDLDNLLGGAMDALVDFGLLSDDRWVMETHARCWKEADDE